MVILATATSARPDWINLAAAETAANIAEITVLAGRAEVVLEAYVGHLATFGALTPDKSVEDLPVLQWLKTHTKTPLTGQKRTLDPIMKLASRWLPSPPVRES